MILTVFSSLKDSVVLRGRVQQGHLKTSSGNILTVASGEAKEDLSCDVHCALNLTWPFPREAAFCMEEGNTMRSS